MSEEVRLLELSLKVMSEQLDKLIGACLDENGKAKAPSSREIAQARGYLPPYCKNAFKK